jgi:diguanylate cyclase (GGDEF)-like protein
MNVTRYKCSVLVVDDDPQVLAILSAELGHDFDILTACSAEQARAILTERTVDILLTDLQLQHESGLRLLEWVRRTTPRTSRVLFTGTARLEDAVDAINQTQVHRLVLKPWRADDLLQTLRAAARTLLLERSHEQLLEELRRLNLDLEKRVQERTAELEAAMAQLQNTNEILEKMALTDPLTSLSNRRAIDLVARKEVQRRVRTPDTLAIGLIDIDHFKQINSNYLLSGGDHALTWIAGVLQTPIRASDSLGRVGGEEFMVVAPGTDAAGAAILAERLRAAVASSVTSFGGREMKMTVSIGFAAAEAGCDAAYDQIRSAAEEALLEAKDAGRNRCVVRVLPCCAGGE